MKKMFPLVALVLSSGCSLIFVKGPPGYIPEEEPVPLGSCTIERFLPILDAVGAGASAVTVLTSSDGSAVRSSAVWGGLLGFSSYKGFQRVNHCRTRMFPAEPDDQPFFDINGFRLLKGSAPLFPERLPGLHEYGRTPGSPAAGS